MHGGFNPQKPTLHTLCGCVIRSLSPSILSQSLNLERGKTNNQEAHQSSHRGLHVVGNSTGSGSRDGRDRWGVGGRRWDRSISAQPMNQHC